MYYLSGKTVDRVIFDGTFIVPHFANRKSDEEFKQKGKITHFP